MLFVFFSSRRRHTRYWRDWSSDVCSSDLVLVEGVYLYHPAVVLGRLAPVGIVEPAVGLGQRVSLWHLFGGLAVVVLEVLLAGEHGVPGGDAPGAVVEGAHDLSLPPHVHLLGPGGWAGHFHRRGGVNAAVVLVALDELPGGTPLFDPEDRAAGRRL